MPCKGAGFASTVCAHIPPQAPSQSAPAANHVLQFRIASAIANSAAADLERKEKRKQQSLHRPALAAGPAQDARIQTFSPPPVVSKEAGSDSMPCERGCKVACITTLLIRQQKTASAPHPYSASCTKGGNLCHC